MYLYYNQYLHNTLPHRQLEDDECSPIEALKVNDEDKIQTQLISIDKLIPDFDKDERYQIYELKIGFGRDVKYKYLPCQVSFVPSISFIDEYDDSNTESNEISLWKADLEDTQREDYKADLDIRIKETNIGLSYYNYHLLHCDVDQDIITIPEIKISYSLSHDPETDAVPLSEIKVRRTTLFKEEFEADVKDIEPYHISQEDKSEDEMEEIAQTPFKLKVKPDSPFDVSSTRSDFEKVAEVLMLECNNPKNLFRILKGVASKLKLPNPKYRQIDTQNSFLQNKLLRFDGAEEFLRLLGFKQSANNQNIWYCERDQPPLSVLDCATNVCNDCLLKCNNKRATVDMLKKFSKNDSKKKMIK